MGLTRANDLILGAVILERYKMLLVKFNANWADVYGFAPMEQEQYDLLVRYYSHPRASFNFGTNEGFENENGDTIASGFSAEEVSDETVYVLRQAFPDLTRRYNPTYGIFPYMDDACEEGIAELDER